jgi:hypothetical protein
MNQKVVTSILSGLLAVLAGAHDAHADSVLHDWAPNFATLDTELTLAYEDMYGLGLRDASSAFGPHVIANSYLSSHYDSIVTPPDLYPAYSSAAPKDRITGRLDFKLDFGSPVLGSILPDDTFALDVNGMLSAVDAFNSYGYESDAIVEGKAASLFYIDATHGGGTPGARVGYVLFPEMSLRAFDTALEVHVVETDPVTGASVASSYVAPHGDVAHQINGDRYYEIQVFYSALVPYGVDPYYGCPYEYTVSYGNPYGHGVPEPSALILGGISILGMVCFRRRRHLSR